jgi:hypothetical protein
MDVMNVEDAIKKDEISLARKTNFHKLPQYLQDFWNEPTNVITGTSWFEESSEFIDFPHPEIWKQCWTNGKTIKDK